MEIILAVMRAVFLPKMHVSRRYAADKMNFEFVDGIARSSSFGHRGIQHQHQSRSTDNTFINLSSIPFIHTSLPVSTPNTIQRSHLAVCLPDSLDLTRCLSILVLDKRLKISWFPRLCFCGRCKNLEFTITNVRYVLGANAAPVILRSSERLRPSKPGL